MKHNGFTIIELMIAVFISSLVIAGAFNIQTVFNQTSQQQEEISDMQNTLDGLKNYMRRTLKNSGAGMATNVEIRSCSGATEILPVINIHNRNNYPVWSDFADGGTDNDPDWIEFIHPTSVAVTSVYDWFSPTWAKVYSTVGFTAGDVVAVNVGAFSCIRRINYILNSNPSYLGWYSRGGAYCINPGDDSHPSCGISNNTYNPTQTVTITSLGEFPFQALRIDNTTYKRPILMHGIRTEQNGQSTYTWSPLAENVEDMQIAWHLDTSVPMDERGDIWINSRDPLPTENGRIRSIRISLVVRTFRDNSKIRSFRPAFEDRTAGTPDNYKRRTITFNISMPNRPITGGTL
ncbi:MAG: PilW family protein [Deltaproteobacteria bacterium]|nr:PilW family protein [Deltaproteobacteria bacterium]